MESEPADLDALLRRAMENYFPEPRAGIEQRVLHHVRASGRPARVWSLAFAGCMAALMIFVVMRPARVVVPSVSRRAPAPVAVAAVREMPVLPLRHHEISKQFSKLRLFPTPTPLTDEEKALQEFAAARPQEMQKLLDREIEKSLEIEELRIPPLQSDGGE